MACVLTTCFFLRPFQIPRFSRNGTTSHPRVRETFVCLRRRPPSPPVNTALNYRDASLGSVSARRIESLWTRSSPDQLLSRAYLLLRLDALLHVITAYHVPLPGQRTDRVLLILVNDDVLRVSRQTVAFVRPYLNSGTLGRICTPTLARDHPGDHRPW